MGGGGGGGKGRFHVDVTLISLRFHFDFTSIAIRIHFGFRSISHWLHRGNIKLPILSFQGGFDEKANYLLISTYVMFDHLFIFYLAARTCPVRGCGLKGGRNTSNLFQVCFEGLT